MTDIVERLTEYADTVTLPHGGEIMHEAAREIERLRSMLEWQSIETAPKDGTTILGAHEHAAFTCWWGEGPESYGWIDGCANEYGDLYVYEPTHWRSLPPPPVKEGE